MDVEARPSPRALVPYVEPERPVSLAERISKFLQPRTSLARLPTVYDSTIGSVTWSNQDTALTRPSGSATFRAWAATPWVFSAISMRKNQVASAEWDIVPFDNTKGYGKRLRDEMRDLFNQPSARLDSFQSWAATIIDDILTLDSGVIEKVRYPNGQIAELWPVRGEWISVDERWDGSDPDRPRYYFVPDGTVRAKFTNEDMIYMIANPRANSSIGLSPMSVLASVIDAELRAMEYNRNQVAGAPPEVILNIGENAPETEVTSTRVKWESKILGKSAMGFIGGYKNPSVMKLRDSNQEMQYREWVDLLIRCIAITLGLAPQDLGITFDVNRSTSETQSQNTEDRGLRPLMSLFQNYMTREVIWDRSYGGRANNLSFQFTSLNLNETKQRADINKVALGSVSWKTVDEARKMDGREPLGGIFSHILILTPKGLLDLSDERYLGEEQLAQVASDAQISVNDAKAEVAAANPAVAPAPPA